MKDKTQRNGTLLILLAGSFWGLMGLFVRELSTYGFTSTQIACLRLAVGALIFLVIVLFTDRKLLRISMKDIPLFIGLGFFSLLFFTVSYFKAIELMPLSTAAILLYTSPIWVMLMSAVFFKEKLTAKKLIALVLAFSGCVLVSGISGGEVSLFGLLCGLGSGVGYALYSIIGTVALRRHKPLTVTTYTFIFAALGALIVSSPVELAGVIAAAPGFTMAWLIPTAALISAVIPYLTYTKGLQSIEAGRASIIACIEPVVASLVGIVLYHEGLSLTAAAGIVLVLSAIVLLNIKNK